MEIKIDVSNLRELYPEWDGKAILANHYSSPNMLTLKAVFKGGIVDTIVEQPKFLYEGYNGHVTLNFDYCTVMIGKNVNGKWYKAVFTSKYDEDILAKVKSEASRLDKVIADLSLSVTLSLELRAKCPHCTEWSRFKATDYGSIEYINEEFVYEPNDVYDTVDCKNCGKPFTLSINPQSIL